MRAIEKLLIFWNKKIILLLKVIDDQVLGLAVSQARKKKSDFLFLHFLYNSK